MENLSPLSGYLCQCLTTSGKRIEYKVLEGRTDPGQTLFLKEIIECHKNVIRMYSYFHVLALFYSYSGFKTVCISNRSLPASVLLFLLPLLI